VKLLIVVTVESNAIYVALIFYVKIATHRKIAYSSFGSYAYKLRGFSVKVGRGNKYFQNLLKISNDNGIGTEVACH
jgi:hypothetical protein